MPDSRANAGELIAPSALANENIILQSQAIQADLCRRFEAGWTHPDTGSTDTPTDFWCKTIEAARRRLSTGTFPRDCFIYSDGPATHRHRPIPGTSCAHYVAHELNIRVEERSAKCLDGYAVTIGQITAGREPYSLLDNEAWEIPDRHPRVGDIWTSIHPERWAIGKRGHAGVIRKVDTDKREVITQACGSHRVYSSPRRHGYFYRAF